MTNLYVTADVVGQPNHGGGTVTWNESQALSSLGPCEVYGRDRLSYPITSGFAIGHEEYAFGSEPWNWDKRCHPKIVSDLLANRDRVLPKLAHFYAGTFSETVNVLKQFGCRISYTAAAHDVEASRREHEKLGIPFDYPHLTDPELWKRYLAGYSAADVLICPSRHSADVMRGYGCTNRIGVIPHGCNLPETVARLPDRFTVGYLGAIGPDKGLRYLIEAWGKLGYKDAVLNIAGRDSTHPFVSQMINQWGGNANFNLMGWVDNVSDFYSGLWLYVQPSVTEGFGIEVLEAMAHGRPVVSSDGVGASDVVVGAEFPACDVDALVSVINAYKGWPRTKLLDDGKRARSQAEKLTWDKIRQRYIELWKGMIS